MRFLGHRSKTVGVSRLYVLLSSIAHYYRSKGLSSPSDHTTVKMMMKGKLTQIFLTMNHALIISIIGLKRKESESKTVRRAKPLEMHMLAEALALLEHDHSLRTWRTVWRMFICYFCFLRFDDIKRLKVKNFPSENFSLTNLSNF